jgi:hypothetical protein
MLILLLFRGGRKEDGRCAWVREACTVRYLRISSLSGTPTTPSPTIVLELEVASRDEPLKHTKMTYAMIFNAILLQVLAYSIMRSVDLGEH